MLPQVLTDFNTFIDGVGYVGRASEVALPKITKKTTEVFNAGMAGPVEVPSGYEKITADLTFSETPAELVSLMKKNGINAIPVRLIGTHYDANTEKNINIEVILTGNFKEMDPGSYKRGDQPSTKFQITAQYYRLDIDDAQLLEIDLMKPFEG